MRLLLDEMYSAALAGALHEAGIDAVTVADLRPAGAKPLAAAIRTVVVETLDDRVIHLQPASGLA